MRVLGVGLSKTGTTSLHRALQILGYQSLHYDDKRLNDIVCGETAHPDFRRYDDVDAVLDLPTAVFYEELLDVYPDTKCILTVRDEDGWWDSVRSHFNDRVPVEKAEKPAFVRALRNFVYGSEMASEFLYRKRYREYNERVLTKIPNSQLLVMRLTEGDGWETLCPFLGKPIPEVPFPHANDRYSQRLAEDELRRLVAPGGTAVLLDAQGLDRERIGDRRLLHFLDVGGYPSNPADDQQAIGEIERLRRAGADHLVFAFPAFWWFDYYTGFVAHLRTHYRCVLQNDRIVAFDLSTDIAERQNS